MKNFALIGNPNSGKTTLFNSLTGSTAHVGNWPGVTVDKREGKYKYKKENIEVKIVDLPGIYSLSPYTSEEVYRFIPGEKLESVHLNDMPEAPTYEFDSKLWELFFDVKDDVFKALEEARNEKVIGSSLEAEVKLNLGEKYKPVREQLEKYLHQLLIVSKVEFTDDETLPKASTIRVEVLKSNGQKCNRCWNYVDELDGDICHRCSEILKETK